MHFVRHVRRTKLGMRERAETLSCSSFRRRCRKSHEPLCSIRRAGAASSALAVSILIGISAPKGVALGWLSSGAASARLPSATFSSSSLRDTSRTRWIVPNRESCATWASPSPLLGDDHERVGKRQRATPSMNLLSRMRGKKTGSSPSPGEQRGPSDAPDQSNPVEELTRVASDSSSPVALDRRGVAAAISAQHESASSANSLVVDIPPVEHSDEQDESSRKEIDTGEGKIKERKGIFSYDRENGPRVSWVARRQSQAIVEEGRRKLHEYLALPPTEYSLLDPSMITRISDDKFRMDAGTLNMLGSKVSPRLFVRVDVLSEDGAVNLVVERVELDGSEAVRSAGGTFNVTSSTTVSSRKLEGGKEGELELRTEASIEIDILVPNENFVPLGVIRRVGNFVMQRVVDVGLPQFTKFLKRDYQKWAKGDDSRSAVAADGESLIASVE